MKKIFKIAICSALVLFPFGQGFAQDQARHEVFVTGGAGLSTLSFDVNNGDHNSRIGGLMGIGYSFFINDNFSINTGAEFTFYNSEATLRSFTDSYKAADSDGPFLFNTSVSDYKEKQSSMYVNIPIMAQYQYPILGQHKLYGALGAKIGIPMNGSYKTSNAKFETSGTFEDMGGATMTNVPGLGFYEFSGRKVDEDIDFKVAFMLSVETGMKWSLSPSLSLYTGVYFDYGLNDIRKNGTNEKFLVYQDPANGVKAKDFQLNSMLQSQYTENGVTHSMTDKVIPMAVGLKVRLAFAMAQ